MKRQSSGTSWHKKHPPLRAPADTVTLAHCEQAEAGHQACFPTPSEHRYKRSAMQDNTDAQYNLGLCYRNGKGVKRDMTLAVKWCGIEPALPTRPCGGARSLWHARPRFRPPTQALVGIGSSPPSV